MAIVNEVITQFTFKGNLQPLDKYNTDIATGLTSSLKFASGVAVAAAAMMGLVTVTLKNSEAQAQLAKRTGESFQAIQELGLIASVTGSSAGALESTIESLSSKIGDASLYGSEDFARLGISIRGSNGELKKASVVLDDVRQKFNAMNLSQKQKVAHLGTLGIDPTLVGMLSRTNSEMATLKNKAQALGVVTDKQGKSIIKYNDALTFLGFGMKSLGIQTSVALAPKLTALSETFVDFLVVNKDLVKDGIGKVVEIISALLALLGRYSSAINTAVVSTVGWKAVLIGLGAILAWIFLPLYALPAAIAAVILIWDDFMVGLEGGETVIAGVFQSIAEYLNISDIFSTQFTDVKKIFNDMIAFIMTGVKKLTSFIPDSILGLFGGDSANIDIKSIPTISPLTNQSSSISNSSAITQDVVVNISSNNPAAAGESVRDVMRAEFSQAQTQLNRGGGR